jgi:hypothetical protein
MMIDEQGGRQLIAGDLDADSGYVLYTRNGVEKVCHVSEFTLNAFIVNLNLEPAAREGLSRLIDNYVRNEIIDAMRTSEEIY